MTGHRIYHGFHFVISWIACCGGSQSQCGKVHRDIYMMRNDVFLPVTSLTCQVGREAKLVYIVFTLVRELYFVHLTFYHIWCWVLCAALTGQRNAQISLGNWASSNPLRVQIEEKCGRGWIHSLSLNWETHFVLPLQTLEILVLGLLDSLHDLHNVFQIPHPQWLIIRLLDSNWIIRLTFLLLQFIDYRLWAFLASIITTWACYYNRSFTYLFAYLFMYLLLVLFLRWPPNQGQDHTAKPLVSSWPWKIGRCLLCFKPLSIEVTFYTTIEK